MFNKFMLLTLKGLLTVLPFVLTIYLLVWMGVTVENLLQPLLPFAFYFPGLGVITIVIILAVIGLFVNAMRIAVTGGNSISETKGNKANNTSS